MPPAETVGGTTFSTRTRSSNGINLRADEMSDILALLWVADKRSKSKGEGVVWEPEERVEIQEMVATVQSAQEQKLEGSVSALGMASF